MSHTNSTTNYNLPQFESTDKPAWLTDVNDAMYAIDNGIAAAQSTADGNTTALADKVDKVAGKGLSENDYTTADKTKLDNLADIKSIGSNLTLVAATGELSATDTTYSNFTGTDGTAAGAAGLVPAPATTDAGKFLKADGTWDTAGGGGSVTLYSGLGNNTDGAMTQKAVTDTLFADGATAHLPQIGANSTANGNRAMAIGAYSKAIQDWATALGYIAKANTYGTTSVGCSAESGSTGNNYGTAVGYAAKATVASSVGLGSYANPTRNGEVNVGTGNQSLGFNSTKYRVIGGVHDGQEDHDVATVGQWKTSLTIATTAPSTPVDGELILYTGATDATFTASPAIYVYSASNTSWTHLSLQ